MKPSLSRLRNVSVSIRCEMPSIERWSSLNRFVRSPSAMTTRMLHLSPTSARTERTPMQLSSVCVTSKKVPPCAAFPHPTICAPVTNHNREGPGAHHARDCSHHRQHPAEPFRRYPGQLDFR